jgi:hypothetical protein
MCSLQYFWPVLKFIFTSEIVDRHKCRGNMPVLREVVYSVVHTTDERFRGLHLLHCLEVYILSMMKVVSTT